MTSTLGPILCGTAVVPDLDEATRAYTDWLGFVVQHEGTVSVSLAAAWRAPKAAGARYRLLGATPTRPGGVRLVERDRPIDESPLRVPGWRCLEISVVDVHEARARLEGSPFTVVGEAKPIGPESPIWATQATGLGREMLYLTQTVERSGFELPLAEHPVDQQFIAVMSAPSLEAASDWYAATFAAEQSLPPAPYTLVAICTDLGIPVERQFRITALGLAGKSLVEIDDHPEEWNDERPPAGDLKAGVALVTWEVDSLDAPTVRPLLPGEPEVRDEPPYHGRRTAVVEGAAGELLELVERSKA